MTIPEIENAWKQAENVWRMNSQRLLNQIPFEDVGTCNRNDQLGDLIAKIDIQVQSISSMLRTFKTNKEKTLPRKLDLKIFDYE